MILGAHVLSDCLGKCAFCELQCRRHQAHRGASSLPPPLERPAATALTSVESLHGVDRGDDVSFSAFKFLRTDSTSPFSLVDEGFSLIASDHSQQHCNDRDVQFEPANSCAYGGVGVGATSSVGSMELEDDNLCRVWSDDYLDASSEFSGRFFRRELNTERLTEEVEPSDADVRPQVQ